MRISLKKSASHFHGGDAEARSLFCPVINKNIISFAPSRLRGEKNGNHDPQSGNALWFILLAIALLVALTIAITHSAENTEQNGERDRDRIEASDILRRSKGIAAAIDQMRLNGLPENNLSFDNPVVAGYANANCTDVTCKLFSPGGAGFTYEAPSSAWLDSTQSAQPLYGEWYVYGTACVPNVGSGDSTCAGAPAATDLILGLPWITQSLCVEINRLAGVANLSNPTRPPVIATGAYTPGLAKFTGTFTAGNIITASGAPFDGKQAGCFQGAASNPSGGYHFYQVVLAR